MNYKKGSVNIVLVVIIVILAAAVGYFALTQKTTPINQISDTQQTTTANEVTQSTTATQQTQQTTTNNPAPTPTPKPKIIDNCGFSTNSVFTSINQYELGLGQNGTKMGYWRIVLDGSEFAWYHSDSPLDGTYTCKNNVLQISGSARTILASYDSASGILIWDNIQYRKAQ